MRRCFVLALVCFAASLVVPVARAQDEVHVRALDKPIKANVKQESASSVLVAGKKDPIPADDILDIIYEVQPLEVRLTIYQAAWKAEKDYNDPAKDAKRKENLAQAVKKYEETLSKMGPAQNFARRHFEFKLALLNAWEAQEGGTADPAIAKLKDFKTKHPDAWQTPRAMRLLARLLLDQKNPAEAEATYLELAGLKVSPQTKNDAELQAALVSLRAGNAKEAQKKLNQLIAKLPAKSDFVPRVKIALAETVTAEGKPSEAIAMLRQLIKDNPDPGLKGAAYNALGKSYYDAKQYKEARWEFLWVDVVYNHDKDEHAKALYYLWKTFDKLGEADRAKEFRETLIRDRQFLGSEFQRLAQSEKGDSAKGANGKAP
jgi:tetratricopeptide (TPR) repeat protein